MQPSTLPNISAITAPTSEFREPGVSVFAVCRLDRCRGKSDITPTATASSPTYRCRNPRILDGAVELSAAFLEAAHAQHLVQELCALVSSQDRQCSLGSIIRFSNVDRSPSGSPSSLARHQASHGLPAARQRQSVDGIRFAAERQLSRVDSTCERPAPQGTASSPARRRFQRERRR